MEVHDSICPDGYRWLMVSLELNDSSGYINMLRSFAAEITKLAPHHADTVFMHDKTSNSNIVNINYIYWLMDEDDEKSYEDIQPEKMSKQTKALRLGSGEIKALYIKNDDGMGQDNVVKLLERAATELSSSGLEMIHDISLQDESEEAISHFCLRVYYR